MGHLPRGRLAPPTPCSPTGNPTGRLGHSWTVEDNLMTDLDETWVLDRGVNPKAARVMLGSGAQHATVTRQLLLSQCGRHAPQCLLEFVQHHGPANLESAADPLVLDEPVRSRSGVDVDVWPEPTAVDQRSSALQLSKVADRAAAEKVDGTDLEEGTHLELEVVRHRLRRPVRLHLRDRHIAEHRAPVDAGFLIHPRLVLQPQSAAEEARDQFRGSRIIGVHTLTIWRLDTHSARSGHRRLDLIGGAELKQLGEPFRTCDPAVDGIAERPCAVTDTSAVGDQELRHGAAPHRFDRVTPELSDAANHHAGPRLCVRAARLRMIERSHGQPSSPTVPSGPGNLQDLQPPSCMRALTNSPNIQGCADDPFLLLVMCLPLPLGSPRFCLTLIGPLTGRLANFALGRVVAWCVAECAAPWEGGVDQAQAPGRGCVSGKRAERRQILTACPRRPSPWRGLVRGTRLLQEFR